MLSVFGWFRRGSTIYPSTQPCWVRWETPPPQRLQRRHPRDPDPTVTQGAAGENMDSSSSVVYITDAWNSCELEERILFFLVFQGWVMFLATLAKGLNGWKRNLCVLVHPSAPNWNHFTSSWCIVMTFAPDTRCSPIMNPNDLVILRLLLSQVFTDPVKDQHPLVRFHTDHRLYVYMSMFSTMSVDLQSVGFKCAAKFKIIHFQVNHLIWKTWKLICYSSEPVLQRKCPKLFPHFSLNNIQNNYCSCSARAELYKENM